MHTAHVTGVGSIRLLEAIRLAGVKCRYYQASSSEMFGASPPPQREDTPFHPRSPYGAAKVYSYWATRNYREAYGTFVVNGILFNHESPRRGETFVIRKITRAVARIKAGVQSEHYLGKLDAILDWGRACTVRELVETAFDYAGLDWHAFVRHDERYLRPSEVVPLVGDAGAAARELGWTASVYAPELVRIMVDADVALLESEG